MFEPKSNYYDVKQLQSFKSCTTGVPSALNIETIYILPFTFTYFVLRYSTISTLLKSGNVQE